MKGFLLRFGWSLDIWFLFFIRLLVFFVVLVRFRLEEEMVKVCGCLDVVLSLVFISELLRVW